MLLLVNPDTYVRKLRKYVKCVWKDMVVAYYCKTLKSVIQGELLVFWNLV